jgi:hypothetical protein
MGLLSGAASFMRFTVEGQLPEPFWEEVAERVRAHSFKDIDDTLEEFSIGWVSVGGMFDADFARAPLVVGDYVVLSMRIDERKVSPAVLKKCALKEEERIKRERQVPRLARSTMMEIKERVRSELVRKSVPIPGVYDLAWNLSDNTVLFFSTSKKALVHLEELFKATFGLSLILQIPWTAAEHLGDDASLAGLPKLRPEILV